MIILRLKEFIPQVDVVAISDYGKGFLTNSISSDRPSKLRKRRRSRPSSILRGSDFPNIRGPRVLKPNLSEAYAAAKCPLTHPLNEVAKRLHLLADILLITRSEAGISIFNSQGEQTDFPVRSKEVKDVTGAGDTVLCDDLSRDCQWTRYPIGCSTGQYRRGPLDRKAGLRADHPL